MLKLLNLSYRDNKIIVQSQGQYKGCDGEMHPYACTFVEGAGAKDVWDYIQYLEQKLEKGG